MWWGYDALSQAASSVRVGTVILVAAGVLTWNFLCDIKAVMWTPWCYLTLSVVGSSDKTAYGIPLLSVSWMASLPSAARDVLLRLVTSFAADCVVSAAITMNADLQIGPATYGLGSGMFFNSML